MLKDEWNNLYPSQWKGLIVEEAIVHPAKFSSKLIRYIYEHMREEGWVKEGDLVIDPFGGVALGAMDAMRLGLRWRGVELEQKFVKLGERNIQEWNERFDLLPMWNSDAHIIQGDSRELLKVLRESGNVSVSSPPWTQTGVLDHDGQTNKIRSDFQGGGDGFLYNEYGSTPGQLGQMKSSDEGFSAAVSSPPFRQSEGGTPEPKEGGTIDKALYERHKAGNAAAKGYGESDANLGNMRANDDSFILAVSSPPYADGAQHTGGDDSHPEHVKGGKIHLPGIAGAVSSPPYAESLQNEPGIDPEKTERVGGPNSQSRMDTRYGSTEGQLGAMKAQGFDAAVSSPPFEKGTEGVMRANKFKDPEKFALEQMNKGHGSSFEAKMRAMEKDNERATYGETIGNLGNDSGDDFWLAARTIVEQVYQALAPGGHAVWVVKDFVKNKKRVPFCDQWRQLCEAVGFVTLHEHHAMLVHHKGTQKSMFGEDVEIVTKYQSFFRRLAEKNGSPPIHWEVVWCMEKPK